MSSTKRPSRFSRYFTKLTNIVSVEPPSSPIQPDGVVASPSSPLLYDDIPPLLCRVCVPLVHGLMDGEKGDHHTKIQSLVSSANDNCRICKSLLQFALKRSGSLEKCMLRPYQYECISHVYRGVRTIGITMDMLHEGSETSETRKFWVIPPSWVTTNHIIGQRTSNIPLIDATRTAKMWMDNCLNTHKDCQKNLQPTSYPTRLLELQDTSVRIIYPERNKIVGPYVALSYCWGPQPITFPTLIQPNLEKYELGIPLSELPIAFQQAVSVIKALNINYLWIDAMCIIQPSEYSRGDWHLECTKMQAVYSNCILTLALASSHHPGESCLKGPSHPGMSPFQLSPSATYGSKEQLLVISTDYYNDALINQPLGSRGWVLQENILPARILSFGSGELFWDCTQLPNGSETFPRGLRETPIYNAQKWASKAGPYNLLAFHGVTKASISDVHEHNALVRKWTTILGQYVRRQLTYPGKDKLTAVSAIAEYIENTVDDKYILGHFQKTLPDSLFWKTEQWSTNTGAYNGHARRIIELTSKKNDNVSVQVPSWSWASMDGELDFRTLTMYDGLLTANMVDCKLAYADDSEQSQKIISATLTIEANCGAVQWDQDKPRVFVEAGQRDDDDLAPKFQIDDPSDSPPKGTDLLIAEIHRHVYWEKSEGLLLQKCDQDGENFFRRIGCFELSCGMKKGNWQTREADGAKWNAKCDTVFLKGMTTLTLI